MCIRGQKVLDTFMYSSSNRHSSSRSSRALDQVGGALRTQCSWVKCCIGDDLAQHSFIKLQQKAAQQRRLGSGSRDAHELPFGLSLFEGGEVGAKH